MHGCHLTRHLTAVTLLQLLLLLLVVLELLTRHKTGTRCDLNPQHWPCTLMQRCSVSSKVSAWSHPGKRSHLTAEMP